MAAGADRTVWLKLETKQPVGSFKIRGIGAACQKYQRRGAERFISSSGGNAGIAVAYAGRHLSVPVVVVVPETTTDRARSLIQHEEAEVIVHGASWYEANELALSMARESDAFLHPFDDPYIWQGHSLRTRRRHFNRKFKLILCLAKPLLLDQCMPKEPHGLNTHRIRVQMFAAKVLCHVKFTGL